MAPAISTNPQDLGDLLKQHEGFEKAAASSVSTLRGRVIDLVAKVRHSQEQVAAIIVAKSHEENRSQALRDAVSKAAGNNDPEAIRAAILAAVSAYDKQSTNWCFRYLI